MRSLRQQIPIIIALCTHVLLTKFLTIQLSEHAAFFFKRITKFLKAPYKLRTLYCSSRYTYVFNINDDETKEIMKKHFMRKQYAVIKDDNSK